MPDTEYTFAEARSRLEDIVSEVRKKDMPLEASLDLLEEGVRLANACTELIDHQDWVGPAPAAEGAGAADGQATDAESDATGARAGITTRSLFGCRPGALPSRYAARRRHLRKASHAGPAAHAAMRPQPVVRMSTRPAS